MSKAENSEGFEGEVRKTESFLKSESQGGQGVLRVPEITLAMPPQDGFWLLWAGPPT